MTRTTLTDKLFTLEQANRTLPLVRTIIRDIVELSNKMVQTKLRLDSLDENRTRDQADVYRDEVQHIRVSLEEDSARLQRYVDELVELGVEAKGLTEGLVDFPSMRGEELIYLCWKYDEPEILFWHSIEGGFAGRQPIDDEIRNATELDLTAPVKFDS